MNSVICMLNKDGHICISGARDRSMVCWRLPTEENESECVTCKPEAHNGWVWGLTAMENIVYSCSWDQTVKAWALTHSGLIQTKTYQMYMDTKLVIFAALVMGRPSEEGMNFYS